MPSRTPPTKPGSGPRAYNDQPRAGTFGGSDQAAGKGRAEDERDDAVTNDVLGEGGYRGRGRDEGSPRDASNAQQPQSREKK